MVREVEVRLGDLIAGTGSWIVSPDAGRSDSVRICDITEDSRTVVPGSLFIARPGLKSDGRLFIAEALEAGASAVLTDPTVKSLRTLTHQAELVHAPDLPLSIALVAERFFGHPSQGLRTIGVTGTNGKTTVSHFVHRLLNLSRVRCGMIGTVVIDDGYSMSNATITTPSAIEMSLLLSRMVESRCVASVLEVSSHALDQRRPAGLSFDIAIFTNLSGDHLDYHRTMNDYFAAKARLFEMLDANAAAIVNIDDAWASRIIERCQARVIRTSLRGEADCSAVLEEADYEGMVVTLRGGWGEFTRRVPLHGEYALMNVLQGVAAVHELGVPLNRLSDAVTLLEPPPGRLQRIRADGITLDYSVFVDYAHTDDALKNVLIATRQLVRDGARLRLVFGCGGDRDASKRARMGRVASQLADHVIITSDNPRTERPGAIIDDILEGVAMSNQHRITVEPDRAHAIQSAVESGQPGDVILIAGKGHENYQLIPDDDGGIKCVDFDDRQVVLRAISSRCTRDRGSGATRHGGGLA